MRQVLSEGLSKLTPAERARLETLVQMAQQPVADTGSKVELNIHLTPGSSLRLDPSKLASRMGSRDELRPLLDVLTPELRSKMIEIEPKVLAWLNQSKANAHAFVVDPLSALKKAVPGIDDNFLASLKGIRASRSRIEPEFPGVEIKKIHVDVAKTSSAPSETKPSTRPR